METLAPRSAYIRNEFGVAENVAIPAAIGFCVITGVLRTVMEIMEGTPIRAAIGEGVLDGVLGGVIWGLLFGGLLAVSNRHRMGLVHAGDARVVSPPPPGALFRLPCGLARGRFAIPGVLYLGPWGMRFEPHRRPRKVHREEVIGPLEAIEVAQEDVALPAQARFGFGGWVPGIVVRWPEGRAELLVPEPAETFGRLRGALDSLHRGAPVAAERA